MKKKSIMSFFIIYLLLDFFFIPGNFAQNIIVHDPVIAIHDNTYYLFCTGWGISVWSSTNLEEWKKEKPVFEKAPEWAISTIPGFKGHIWAPDVFYHNGKYYLYYSVSAFGKNTSCIGVATNTVLNADHPDYFWEDHGKVIQSVPGRDMWNAIDPNLILDESGVPWLSFGSFWNGIKLVKLNNDLISISEPQEWYTLSRRERLFTTHDSLAGEGAVEAPFIFKKDNYYYLFVSFDFCCRGVNSNYKVMVGRSEKIYGPYTDRKGKRLDEGGGTPVIEGNKQWPGVGHNSVYTFNNNDYLVIHAYDASDEGKPKLMIKKIRWDNENWPSVSLSDEIANQNKNIKTNLYDKN
jgi:arabinan endo-1,5-alpha-L-arabinosidase